jgi:hypothetical protein
MAFGPVIGPVLGPALRWSTNQALRSHIVDEIRDEFQYEIWETRDLLLERIDHMIAMMERLVAIVDKVSETAESMRMLASTILTTDVLTNEQLGQLLTAIAAAAAQQSQTTEASSAPTTPAPPTTTFGATRGRRW